MSLDDATPAAGKWEAGKASSNARKVAQDANTIGLLGEFNSGASAISIPILNRGGILQVSPSNTRVGLTKSESGRRAGRARQVLPERQAQLRARRSDRHDPGRRAGAVHEGRGCQERLRPERQGGLRPGRRQDTIRRRAGRHQGRRQRRHGTARRRTTARWRPRSRQRRGRRLHRRDPPRTTRPSSTRTYAAMPNAKLFGPDGVAETAFTNELPAVQAKHTFLTVPTVAAGRAVRAAARSSTRTTRPSTAAAGRMPVRGLRLRGDAASCSTRSPGGDDREAVIDASSRPRTRQSVLGHVRDRPGRRHHAHRLRRIHASRTASWCSTRSSRPNSATRPPVSRTAGGRHAPARRADSATHGSSIASARSSRPRRRPRVARRVSRSTA